MPGPRNPVSLCRNRSEGLYVSSARPRKTEIRQHRRFVISGYDDVSFRSNEAVQLGADKPNLTLINGSDARASAYVPIEADLVDARTKFAGPRHALRASNGMV